MRKGEVYLMGGCAGLVIVVLFLFGCSGKVAVKDCSYSDSIGFGNSICEVGKDGR